MNYDVIIIGAGPGGIFAAYELMKKKPECKIAVFAASGEQEHFLMGNIILPMISGEHCSNISGRNRQ